MSLVKRPRILQATKVASSEDTTFHRVDQSNKKLEIYKHSNKIIKAFIRQDKKAIKSIGNNLKHVDLINTEVFKS